MGTVPRRTGEAARKQAAGDMSEPIGREACAYIAGDGEYDIEVDGTSEFQETLEWLARGLGEEPTDYECTAVLVPDVDDPDDPDAISVMVLGQLVGYLPPDSGERMLRAMESWKFDYAKCEAVIGGGWYRNKDDRGDFQIWLDVNPHFKPLAVSQVGEATVAAVALAPAQPAVIPTEVAAEMVAAAPARRIGLTRREMGVAASTSVAILAAVGIAWLLVPPMQAPSSTSSEPDTVIASPTSDLSDQERLEAKVAQRDFSPVVVGPQTVAALTPAVKAMEPAPARREIVAEFRPIATRPDRPATAAVVPALKPPSGATVTGAVVAAVQPSSARSVAMTVPAPAIVASSAARSATIGAAAPAAPSAIAADRPASAPSQQTVGQRTAAIPPSVISRAGPSDTAAKVLPSAVAVQSTAVRAASAAPPDAAMPSIAKASIAKPSTPAPGVAARSVAARSVATPSLAAANPATSPVAPVATRPVTSNPVTATAVATSPVPTSTVPPAVQPSSGGVMNAAVTPVEVETKGTPSPAARPATQDRSPAAAPATTTHEPADAEQGRPSRAIASRAAENRRHRITRADRGASRYRGRTARSARTYRPRRWSTARERDETPTQAGPRTKQLRPGETMASRLFEDGIREWAEKGPPSMFLAPPPPRY